MSKPARATGAEQRSFAEIFVCLVVLLLTAAASFNGFYDKWGFLDDEIRYSTQVMLDGEAYRPFVYRQFNAQLTNAIADASPADLKATLQELARGQKPSQSTAGPDWLLDATPDWFWRYTVLYTLTFAEWFAALLVLTALCTRFAGFAAGLAASCAFGLIFPLLLSQGGFFYDFPEMLFLSLAAYFASRGWLLPLTVVAIVGTTNKETMVFFLPTLLPFLASRIGGVKALAVLVPLTLAAALTYLSISLHYADNAGVRAEFHLFRNILFYGNPLNLLAVEETYGLPLFRAYSIVGLGFLATIAVAGWQRAPRTVRGHFLLALLINLPLFVVLAYRAEMRNLSLIFVGWTLLLACALRPWLMAARNLEPTIKLEARP